MTQQTYTPDWSKAPTNANWHARDSDGCGFWYNKRPALSRDFWAAGCSLTIADNDCPVLDHDAALDNWRDTLTVRPFQDRDIPQNLSDYFSGKTPFITAYVDLLLARMAKEGRFSDGETVFEPLPFDIFKGIGGLIHGQYLIVRDVSSKEYSLSIKADVLSPSKCIQRYNSEDRGTLRNHYEELMRPITELEAVEFRAAMEAVYG